MKQQNGKTKKTLISSIIVLIVCVAMLLGTTFAWFSDSVSNTGNRIQAGKLDIDLLMAKKNAQGGFDDYVSIAGSEGDIFKEATVAQDSNITLWEPGKTQVAYLAIKNNGSLALKFKYYMDVIDHGLCDDGNGNSALQYAILPLKSTDGFGGATSWTEIYNAAKAISDSNAGDVVAGRSESLKEGVMDEITKGIQGETEYFAIFVHMKEDAGNAYQDKYAVIDVFLQAAQYSSESDAFGPYYDATATYDEKQPAKETITKTVETGKATEFSSGLSPSGTGGTTVIVPDGGLATGTAKMTFETQNVEEAQTKFTVTAGKAAVAGIDLTVKLDGTEVTTFNDKEVQVTTYIVKGLTQSDLTITHEGSKDGITLKSYDAITGKLVYTTTHFSDFCVDSTAIGYFPATNTAYYNLTAASEEGGSFIILRNFDIAVKASIKKDMVIDLNGKVVSNYLEYDRMITVDVANVNLTINGTKAGSKFVTPDTVTTYGFVNMNGANAKLTVNGGEWIGDTDQGALIKVRKSGIITTLNNVTMSSNYGSYNEAYSENTGLFVNGGKYTATNAGGYGVFYTEGPNSNENDMSAILNSVEADIYDGSFVHAAGGSSVQVNSCNVLADAADIFNVVGKATLYINGGIYKNVWEEGDALSVLNSGGKITVYSGTFESAIGFYLGNTSQAGTFGVNIVIKGGDFTFTSIGSADGGGTLTIPGKVGTDMNPATFSMDITDVVMQPGNVCHPLETGYRTVLGEDGKYHILKKTE